MPMVIRGVVGLLLVCCAGCGAIDSPRTTTAPPDTSRASSAAITPEPRFEPIGAPMPDESLECLRYTMPYDARFIAHSWEWPHQHQSFDEGIVSSEFFLDPRRTFILEIHGQLSPCEMEDPALPYRRAAAVARALIERGVPAERVVLRSIWTGGPSSPPLPSRRRASRKTEPDTCRPEDGLLHGYYRRAGLTVYWCETPEERAARQQRTRSAPE